LALLLSPRLLLPNDKPAGPIEKRMRRWRRRATDRGAFVWPARLKSFTLLPVGRYTARVWHQRPIDFTQIIDLPAEDLTVNLDLRQ
jgi:hypothetical protein